MKNGEMTISAMMKFSSMFMVYSSRGYVLQWIQFNPLGHIVKNYFISIYPNGLDVAMCQGIPIFLGCVKGLGEK